MNSSSKNTPNTDFPIPGLPTTRILRSDESDANRFWMISWRSQYSCRMYKPLSNAAPKIVGGVSNNVLSLSSLAPLSLCAIATNAFNSFK
ncbi:unnamed protein product [Phytophthora lilii]|uniref:Unnamed protein product n=1 Tax=Phytophthora lilii TaxID=2077276 RepID=A0A9W6XEG0_9STRA|nr:unnamed protein product [Phytophthora lilii]